MRGVGIAWHPPVLALHYPVERLLDHPALAKIMYTHAARTSSDCIVADFPLQLGFVSSPVLCVEHLDKRFFERSVLRGVNLQVAAGEVVVLVGPNGSGKSTLLGAIGGTVVADAGSVEIAGVDLAASPLLARTHLRFLAQEIPPPTGLSGRDWIDFYADVFTHHAPSREQLYQLADLGPQLDHLVTTFSLGMRRRLSLAGLMAGEGKLFVLDEPFAGVDPDQQQRWVNVLSKRVKAGAGLLLAAHAADERSVVAFQSLVPTRVVTLADIQQANAPSG